MKKLAVSLCVLASVLSAAPVKVTYGDVAGKNYYSTYEGNDIRVQYFSNMNFNTQIKFFGTWYNPEQLGYPNVVGEWAIENGVVTSEGIPNNDVNKTIATIQPDFANAIIISNLSGRGEIITDDTTPYGGKDDISGDITPGYEVSIAELKGKKITLGSETLYLFNNMTSILMEGSTTLFKGTWKVENGVLVWDGGWEDYDGNGDITGVVSETSSILFSAAPAAGAKINVWTNAMLDGENVNIDAFADISVSDPVPVPFNNDPAGYTLSVEELAGKTLVVEDEDATQTRITFNDNMTFREEVDIIGGTPAEINTGIWSVEEGVLILDVVYNDHSISQSAAIFPEKPKSGISFEFIYIRTSDSETGGDGFGVVAEGGKTKLIDYPSDETANASPAIIMYLLN